MSETSAEAWQRARTTRDLLQLLNRQSVSPTVCRQVGYACLWALREIAPWPTLGELLSEVRLAFTASSAAAVTAGLELLGRRWVTSNPAHGDIARLLRYMAEGISFEPTIVLAERLASTLAVHESGAAVSGSGPKGRLPVEWPRENFGPLILRDLFDGAFVAATAGAPWCTPLVQELATVIEDAEQYAAIPLLHDTLVDAGCVDAAILQHLREERVHVPGCWVVARLAQRRPE